MQSERNEDIAGFFADTIKDMKSGIPVSTIVLAFLVFQICITHVKMFNITCPSGVNWKIRAKVECNSTLKYFCLYNNVEGFYVEGCKGPDWDRKGSKRIFSGSFTRGNCSHNRYQPFRFQTNEMMTDCIYEKSRCSEEGQTVYKDDSTRKDITCQCDYTKNYSFIKTPKQICYCTPTEEDCSCQLRSFQANYTLTTDNNCIPNGYREDLRLLENNRQYETGEEIQRFRMYNFWFHTTSKFDLKSRITATVLFGLCFIIIIGGVFVIVLFDKMICEKIQLLMIFLHRRKPGTFKPDDVNFLRLIHILFRVAFPVVRMKLNNEIKGKTGICKISSVYPDTSDISDSAMLSRIKYIRNKATRRFEANLSEDEFKQNWNDIRQAVQALVCTLDNENDREKTRRIENLKIKSHLIPEACHLHHQDYTFAHLTAEENNFLIAFYVIAKIVYPVIKNEFNKHCTYWKFEDICQTQHLEDKHCIKKQEMFFTHEQQQQQYSPKMDESRNLYMSMMISKLRIQAAEEDKKDYTDQLDVINDIRREIVQSSSGKLNDERLHYILIFTKQAVLYFGGKWSEKTILRLQSI